MLAGRDAGQIVAAEPPRLRWAGEAGRAVTDDAGRHFGWMQTTGLTCPWGPVQQATFLR